MPDRSKMPPLRPLETLRSPQPKVFTLPNGLKLYCLDAGQLEVARLDLAFFGGRWTEHKPLVARGVCDLMLEGSCHHTGTWIAEQIDFFGASMGTTYLMDGLEVSLFSLTRYFHELLPLLVEVVTCPAFPDDELSTFIEQSKASLLVDLQKPDVVAYRTFTEMIFGSDHPYGYNSTPAAYDALTRADLQRFATEHFHAANAFALLSGRLNDRLLRLVHEALSQLPRQGAPAPPKAIPPLPPHGGRRHIDMPHQSQTAIYVGRRLWPRSHPDFPAMYVLTQILGGYFGSRLIKRIREKLGYTYSIYADLEMMRHSGYFYITTQVAPERVHETLHEIFAALHNLTARPPDQSELQMVRHYLLGNMLANVDGPFNQADYIRTPLFEDSPPDMLERIGHVLYHTTPEELQALATTWLQPDTMTVVTAGPKAKGMP